MVGTMAPVVYGGEGSESRRRWLIAISLYIVSLLGAAIILGSLLGMVGEMLPLGSGRNTWGTALISLLSLLYALHELRAVRLPYPEFKRQVQAEWRYRFHPYITSMLFGVQLGLGHATYVTVASLYIVTVATVIYGSPLLGAILFGLFGLGRAGLLLPLAWHAQTYHKVYQISTSLIATKLLVHLCNGSVLAFSGAYLAATLYVKHLNF